MKYCDIADIIIVGGGASGMAAAIQAKRENGKLRVILLEKLDRVGKKLLVTGNGRCNLGNCGDRNGRYNTGGAIPVLERFGDSGEFFESMGLLVRRDEEDRLYPRSNSAASVLDALRFELERLGAEMITAAPVQSISPGDGGFDVQSGAGVFRGKRVITAAGGRAAPKFGTEGDGCALAKSLGIPVTRESPALVAVRTGDAALKALKGQRVTALARGIYEDGGEKVRLGEVQFGDGTLSGICVFDLAQPGLREVRLDLLPGMEFDEVQALIGKLKDIRGAQSLENLLTGVVPKRVGMQIIKQKLDLPLSTASGELQDWQLAAIAGGLKNWRFSAAGTLGWDSAQTTAGGVPLSEVTENLESRIVPGLYFAGEVLDVNGDCGGYNLDWAWASGRCAGAGAAKSLEEQNA